MFGSGSEALRHVERQQCQHRVNPELSCKKEDLYDSIQRKAIIKDILEHHGELLKAVNLQQC